MDLQTCLSASDVSLLRRFAEMDRPRCHDLEEVAVQRGIASDLTLLTSGDFRAMHELYKRIVPICDCEWCREGRAAAPHDV